MRTAPAGGRSLVGRGAEPRRGRSLLVIALLAASCGGPRPPETGGVQPTLESLQRNVFDPSCATAGCHGGPRPESGLDLRSGLSHGSLVSVPSVQIPDLLRVAPGAPDRSYLVRKIEGHRIVGERMPNGETPLPEEAVAAVREWIACGARED